MNQFLPFITDDQGRSLDTMNEVVVTRSLPTPIDNSPEGWENNTIQFARNNEFRGLIKSYTTSLKFYLQGAKILRDAFYRKGMETILYFIWLKLDQSFGGGMQHKGWYKGEPDFGTFKDEWDGVSINITEGGFYKDLQANKTVTQEIPFDSQAISVYVDGVNLRQKLNYTDVEDLEVSLASYGARFFGPYQLISQDGASTGFVVNSEQLETRPSVFADALLSLNTIITNVGTVAINVTISGTLEFICTSMTSSPAYAVKFRYLRSNQLLADQDDYVIMTTAAMVVGQTYTQAFSITIPLAPSERLYRDGFFFGGVGSDAVIKFTANSKSSINFITRQAPIVILAYRAVVLGSKLADGVSTGATLTSPLLDPDYNLMITSGDAIRGIVDAVIKTSFSDWHKSIDAVKCVALDVVNNNPVVYDRYAKYDRTSTIADLGECANWTAEVAQDYVYDVVNVGYPAKQVDSNIDVNGRYSFNNTFVWKISVTRRMASPYDAVSKYGADPYDISLIRVNMEGKDTTTGSSDNSNFFLDCELKTDVSFTGTVHLYHTDNRIELDGDVASIAPFIAPGVKLLINGSVWTVKTVVDIDTLDVIFEVVEFIPASVDTTGTVTLVDMYQLRRPVFDSIAGIPADGTEFNLLLSPRRILERHLRWLRSSFDHLDANKLIFQSTEKNKELVTVLSGVTVDEDADIPIATMGDKVYLPYYNIFEIKSPDNLLGLMTANNSGKFSYQMNGIDLDGFPEEIKTEDSYLETQTYKLLQTANCDNLQLINNR